MGGRRGFLQTDSALQADNPFASSGPAGSPFGVSGASPFAAASGTRGAPPFGGAPSSAPVIGRAGSGVSPFNASPVSPFARLSNSSSSFSTSASPAVGGSPFDRSFAPSKSASSSGT